MKGFYTFHESLHFRWNSRYEQGGTEGTFFPLCLADRVIKKISPAPPAEPEFVNFNFSTFPTEPEFDINIFPLFRTKAEDLHCLCLLLCLCLRLRLFSVFGRSSSSHCTATACDWLGCHNQLLPAQQAGRRCY